MYNNASQRPMVGEQPDQTNAPAELPVKHEATGSVRTGQHLLRRSGSVQSTMAAQIVLGKEYTSSMSVGGFQCGGGGVLKVRLQRNQHVKVSRLYRNSDIVLNVISFTNIHD